MIHVSSVHKLIHANYPQWLLPLQTAGNTQGVQTRQVNSLCNKRPNNRDTENANTGTQDLEHAGR